jgi:uncharacterized membrane protein YvlD (DUF360 family)
MVRVLINLVIYLASAALALWVASLVLDDFNVTFEGLIIAAVIFAILQAILAPFIFNMARKYASFLLGGVGLVSTFLALWITTLVSDGLSITGVTAWVVGTLIVWLITAIGGWLLGLIFLKKRAAGRDN